MKIHILTIDEEQPDIVMGLQKAGFDVTWGNQVPKGVDWVLTPSSSSALIKERSLTRLVDTITKVRNVIA